MSSGATAGLRGFASSLRFRLTAWYCLILLGTMGMLALVLYVAARREIIGHHDEELIRAAAAVEAILGEHEDCAQLAPDQRTRLDDIGGLILVHEVAGEGQVFYRSQASARFPVPGGLLDTTDVARGEAWFDTYSTSAGLVRVYSAPYRSHAGRAGVIRIMDQLGDVEEMVHALRAMMLLLAPVGLLVAFTGGLWLAGRALRPVDRVTSLAREIGAKNLSLRLPSSTSADELGRLVDTLNEMIARLEASFAGMGRFTADASHELRTPLASIASAVDVALSRPRAPGEYVASLESIAEDVQGLRIIVDDLLVLASADAGSARLRAEPMRLDLVARDVVESFEAAAAEAGVALRLEASEAVTVMGDEPWLRQLMSNLVDNAIKFSRHPPPGQSPEVRVALRVDDDDALLTVADRGPGIPDADLPRLFDRFYRGDAARTRGEGVGLGLAIAHWVASAHGGSLGAANRDGGGALFTLRLSIVTAQQGIHHEA